MVKWLVASLDVLLLMEEILHPLIRIISNSLQGFFHPRSLAGFLPSTVGKKSYISILHTCFSKKNTETVKIWLWLAPCSKSLGIVAIGVYWGWWGDHMEKKLLDQFLSFFLKVSQNGRKNANNKGLPTEAASCLRI